MFPYSSTYNPFPHINQTPLPENNFMSRNSSDENPNLPHNSELPTLLEDDGLLLSHLLSQQQLLADQAEASSFLCMNQAVNMKKKDKTTCREGQRTKMATPRKRSTGKKDRHSKICTAQGPRDRRMRLSLHIARKFFDLQDMLGFDKASNTIEWLFHKSKAAIKQVKENVNYSPCKAQTISSSSPSNKDAKLADEKECEEGFEAWEEKKKRKLCKVGRESRDKARARARERTREKMKITMFENSKQSSTEHHAAQNNNNNNDTSKDSRGHLWESKSLETGEESGSRCCNQAMIHSLKMVTAEVDHQEQYSTTTNIELMADNHGEHVDSVSLNEELLDLKSQQIAVSSGGNSEDDFLCFAGNYWAASNGSKLQESFCCTMTGTMQFATTGNVLVQNPCVVFRTHPDTQEEKAGLLFSDATSTFLTTSGKSSQEPNPSFSFHGQ